MRRGVAGRVGTRGATLTVALALLPATAAAQEEVPRDTAAAADTAAADLGIGELPGELVGVLADSAALDSSFAVLADPLRPAPERIPGDVTHWDRERIRRSNALTLGELLAEMTPGALLLRANFVGGPLHLVDGPFGPTAVEVRVDGRPLVPLVGAQPDLSQILLAMVDEVRVRRGPAGLRVELTTLRRRDRRAYSRVEAGSGDPDLESLRLVFTNGIGGAFATTAGFELLDSGSPESDLQGFSGGLAWLPGGGTSGLEVQYAQRSFDLAIEDPGTGTRSRLVFGGRLGLTDHLQAGAWIGESRRELDAVLADGEGGEDAGGAPPLEDAVTHGGAELRAVWDRGWGNLGARFADGSALPSREFEAEAGLTIVPWLAVDGGARLGARDDVDTHETWAGLAARVSVAGADVRLHGRWSAGLRGAGWLAADTVPADTVGSDAVVAGIDVGLGRFVVGGRLRRQRIDRQLSFGTGFDEPAVTWPEAEVISYEAIVDVPVVPLGWLLRGFDPIRARGVYRHNQIESAATPLYVPVNALRGELYFEDAFLEDDLGVRLALGLDRRDPWLAPPGVAEPGAVAVAVPSRSTWNFDVGLRIVGARIFWRYDNVAGRVEQDLPGFEFPVVRQVFGVRWAFYD